MTIPRYAAVLTAWKPATRANTSLYFATDGFVSTPASTPANTHFDGRLVVPGTIEMGLTPGELWSGHGPSRFGSITLLNGDGGLDYLLDYGLEGQPILVYRCADRLDLFPGSGVETAYRQCLCGYVDGIEWTETELRLTVTSQDRFLDQPLHQNKYLGNNVAPNGLEGAEDLKGQVKPRLYGVMKNVPAVLVNESKLIYQVSDGATTSIDAVYDNGISLTTGWQWSLQSVGGTTNTLWDVEYGSDVGLWMVGGASGILYTSPDGKAPYTSRTSNFGADAIYAFAKDEAAPMYVAVGANAKLSSSPDGTTWTARTSQFGADAIFDVCYSEPLDLFCAVGAAGKISTSPDGTTWTARTSGVALDFNAVAWGNDVFVACGATANLRYSADGITWSAGTAPLSGTNNLRNVAYGNGVFVMTADALTYGYGQYFTSVDGRTWIRQESEGDAGPLPGIRASQDTYFGDRHCVVGWYGYGGSDDSYAGWSSDGVNWVQTPLPFATANSVRACAYGAATWVVCGSGGKLYYGDLIPYANTTDLLDDTKAPAGGMAVAFLDGGMFRLGSSPAGLITVDATEGATAADRTAGQIAKRMVVGAGFSTSGTPGYTNSHFTALDGAQAAECGVWFNREVTLKDAMTEVLAGVGAAFWQRHVSGALDILRVDPPGDFASLAIDPDDLPTITDQWLLAEPRIKRLGGKRDRPIWRAVVKWGRNHAVQDGDGLAAAATAAYRTRAATEWRQAAFEDWAVREACPEAREVVVESAFSTAAAAEAEAERLVRVHGLVRHVIELDLPLWERFYYVPSPTGIYPMVYELLLIGVSTLNLGLTRWGLSGVRYRVMAMEWDFRRDRAVLTLWGPNDPTSRLALGPTMSGTGAVT